MKLEDLTTIDQLTEFLAGTQAVAFLVAKDKNASNLRLLPAEQERGAYSPTSYSSNSDIPSWVHPLLLVEFGDLQ